MTKEGGKQERYLAVDVRRRCPLLRRSPARRRSRREARAAACWPAAPPPGALFEFACD
jgi:hypothetical protein